MQEYIIYCVSVPSAVICCKQSQKSQSMANTTMPTPGAFFFFWMRFHAGNCTRADNIAKQRVPLPSRRLRLCTEVTRMLNHKCIQELLHAQYIICGFTRYLFTVNISHSLSLEMYAVTNPGWVLSKSR